MNFRKFMENVYTLKTTFWISFASVKSCSLIPFSWTFWSTLTNALMLNTGKMLHTQMKSRKCQLCKSWFCDRGCLPNFVFFINQAVPLWCQQGMPLAVSESLWSDHISSSPELRKKTDLEKRVTWSRRYLLWQPPGLFQKMGAKRVQNKKGMVKGKVQVVGSLRHHVWHTWCHHSPALDRHC